MAVTRVVIHKTISWRGTQEDFSNVYTLTGAASAYTPATWPTFIDSIVNVEKAMHSALVTFKVAYGGDPVDGTLHVRTLSGTGSLSLTGLQMHPETCALAQATVDRKRRLQKFFHIGRYDAASGGDAAAPFQAMTAFTTNLAKLTDGTLTGGVKVCAPNGDVPTGPFILDPYLRTHQFPRGRRRPR